MAFHYFSLYKETKFHTLKIAQKTNHLNSVSTINQQKQQQPWPWLSRWYNFIFTFHSFFLFFQFNNFVFLCEKYVNWSGFLMGGAWYTISQATTGMWVTDECKNSFMEMKWKKVHKYIVFKIDEGSKLVTVDKVGGPAESYDDLAASLPTDDCRYAVFDFDFVTVDNCRKSKIFFIAWFVTAKYICC